ncbi:MAG: manganese efflux pump MntP family protein [Bacteroidales bacterium]|nr:manganese efflux pump MntP family protein [Bacteroidales bacterium]
MPYFTTLAILFFLAAQLYTVALGIEVKKNSGKALLFALVLSVGQALLFFLGLLIGAWFMHLMDSFQSFVVFAAFFLIGIRMLMESFQAWKGQRTYSVDSLRLTVFLSLAQGINAFLVGLIFVFFPVEKLPLVIVLTALAFIVSLAGIFIQPKRKQLTLAALLFVFGGVVMLFSSIYLGFFAF